MLLTSPLSSPLKNPVRDAFSPAGGSSSLTAQVQALFAAGRVGGMWDLGDIATLFQHYATPVTAVTQPIDMVLDKSQGLVRGAEKVTGNTATFDTGVGSWIGYNSATIAAVGGELQITQNAINGRATIRLPCTSGVFCEVSADVRSINGVACALGVGIYGDGNGAAFAAATTSATFTRQTLILKSLDANPAFINITVGANGGGTGIFAVDNVSVRELPGNHATQPTAGSRPLYQVVSSYGCAQFDGTDDLLQVSGINLSATNKVLIGLAFKPNTTALSVAMEYSTTAVSNVGAFYVSLNESGTGKHNMLANNGGGGGLDVVTLSSAVALAPTVLIDYIDLAQLASIAKHSVRVNGASAGITSIIDGPDVAGNFGNYNLFLGARSGSSLPSNMNLYRAFVLAGSSTAGEQLILENWLRESCGV